MDEELEEVELLIELEEEGILEELLLEIELTLLEVVLELLGALELVLLSCLEELEVEVLVGTEVTLVVVPLLSSLDVALLKVLVVLSKELKEIELDVTPTLHEGMINAVNKTKALKTCLFFITS